MRQVAAVCLMMALAGCRTAAPAQAARRPVGLTIEEARELVADLEARQAAESVGEPLCEPKSLDDVLEILKRDQIDLFPKGIAYASKQEGARAEALRAQIELAWGEAQSILAEVFADTSGQLDRAVRALEIRVASGEATSRQQDRLLALAELSVRSTVLAEALNRLAAEHVGAGARLAKELIARNPSDYLGYRVAADYYRLREDWPAFETLLRKIEETNPDSNGLVFLRGAAALGRDRNPEEAQKQLRLALEKDPKFTRAQAQLVLSKTGARDTYAEYQRLRALNPHHQIVIWAGEAITTAFEAQRARD